MRLYKRLAVYFSIVLCNNCQYKFPELPTPDTGSADFSKTIAIGNSLTAGFANGALYDQGQANAYVNIIAGQINRVTPVTFNQPDINSPVGYSGATADGTPMGRLILVNPANPFPMPIIPGDPFNDNYAGDKAALNNFGVPGLRLIDVDVAGYAGQNRYFKRFALDVNNSSVLSDALAANATFFTFWLGNNDILGYATGGATGNENGDGSNGDDLVSVAVFTAKYATVIARLVQDGAQGVIANIPDVTDIPFFTTVPYNFLSFNNNLPADTLAVYTLNQQYANYNQGLAEALAAGEITADEAGKREVGFTFGANALLIYDEYLTDLSHRGLASIRPATGSDLLTFRSALVIGRDLGAGTVGTEAPLEDAYVLTPEEQSIIAARTAEFNAVIKTVAGQYSENLALVDMNTVFREFAANGVSINGSLLTASIFPPFGGFSLDGIHPNPRGAAFIANRFIEAINRTFAATIPLVNPNNYPGNELPVLN